MQQDKPSAYTKAYCLAPSPYSLSRSLVAKVNFKL